MFFIFIFTDFGIFRGGLQKKTDFMNLSQNYLQNDVILSAAKNLKNIPGFFAALRMTLYGDTELFFPG
ncbi:MAG: hypothetical protein BWK80_28295 [Desulfobacteraceae bacterium IS3]|nr:MAG: hypothetical protein BWK80_28295 [Desulfobacteraceae bacterium IS3]